MDDAMRFLLSVGWQRPTTTYVLLCQNGLCRHGWAVSTTATPAVACPACGSLGLLVERIEPLSVIKDYMAAHEEHEEEPPKPEWNG